MEPIFLLYDTTLRDGSQGEDISFSAEEKLKIALRLDDIGIHYIEGGWPGSNPKDLQFFELARKASFAHARLAAFGCTRQPGRAAENDPHLQALHRLRHRARDHLRQELGLSRHGQSWAPDSTRTSP